MTDPIIELVRVTNANYERVETKLDQIFSKISKVSEAQALMDQRVTRLELDSVKTPVATGDSVSVIVAKFIVEHPRVAGALFSAITAGYPLADVIKKWYP